MSEQLIVRFVNAKQNPVACDVVFTTDQRSFPFWSEWRSAGPGQMAIAYPKTQPFGLAVLWEVPGFGKIIVTADNEGKGYQVGGPQVLDFRMEAAKSKVKKVREKAQALTAAGYQLAPELRGRIERATSALASALGSQGEAAARQADEALKEAFWAGEGLELTKARSDISKMSAERRQALLFGTTYFDPDMPTEHIKQRFVELFNFATVPFYRYRFEPVEGKPDWDLRSRCLDWIELKGIKAKGHPLSWYNNSGLTPWMQKLSYSTLMELIYRQIYDTVSYYKNRIKIWDVINEAHDPVANILDYSHDQMLEATAVACRAVHDADPEAIRIVNTNRPGCYYRARYETRNPMHTVEYLEALAQRGIEYEVIGLQMYHGGQDHWVRDMADQSALIDQFTTFGKPIHITEVQTPSSMEKEDDARREKWDVASAGWWHRAWDLETQADWIEQYYTIAISKPLVGAITWWSFSDRRTFWPSGGFLDQQDQPKPSFYRLKGLIESIRQG